MSGLFILVSALSFGRDSTQIVFHRFSILHSWFSCRHSNINVVPLSRQEEERRRREEEMIHKREVEEQMRRQREEKYRGMGNFMENVSPTLNP